MIVLRYCTYKAEESTFIVNCEHWFTEQDGGDGMASRYKVLAWVAAEHRFIRPTHSRCESAAVYGPWSVRRPLVFFSLEDSIFSFFFFLKRLELFFFPFLFEF